MTEGWCLGPFTNTLSPSLPKPPISQDMFLVPKVAPLIIHQLWERLGYRAWEFVDTVVCAGLGQVSGWQE